MKNRLQRYLGIIKRHKIWFIIPVIAVPLAIILAALQNEPLYQAKSEVIFFPELKEAAWSEDRLHSAYDVQLNSVIAMMGRDSVKNKINAAYRAEIEKKQRIKLADRETIPYSPFYRADKKYHVITITVADKDASLAEFMSNFLANLMVAEYAQLNSSNPDSMTEALAIKISEAEKRLDLLDSVIKEYKEENNIPPDPGGRKSNIQNQLDQLLSNRSEMKGRIEELKTKISSILSRLNIGSADEALLLGQISRNKEIQALQNSLIEAKIVMEEMNSKYGTAHPRFQQAEYLVNELDSKFKNELQGFLSDDKRGFVKKMPDSRLFLNSSQLGMIDELLSSETELKAKEANYSQTKSEIDALEEQVALLPKEEYELNRLEREHKAVEKELSFLQEQKESMALSTGSNSMKVQVSKRARVLAPESPLNQILLAFASIPIIGILMVLLWERLDERIYTKRDLEQLIQLPVIHEIPLDKAAKSKSSQRDFPSLLGDGESKVVLIPEISGTPLKQELFQLKSRLSALSQRGQKIFTILSPEPGSGTTFLISNLAVLFAESGMKTLIIDGNIRSPEIHSIFNTNNDQGLTDLLQGKANIKEVINHIQKYGSLFTISAGIPEHDPLYYLEHIKIADLMESLKKHFDIILFNAPSDMNLMDLPVLANLSQKVILNIRQDDVTTSRIRLWKRQLELVNRDKLGLIINFKTA